MAGVESEHRAVAGASGIFQMSEAMQRDRLYLIRPQFMDGGEGPFFCPYCAQMVGLLEFYPELRQRVEVRWVDFARPRRELVELLGEENQSCPVLVLSDAIRNPPPHLQVRNAKGRWFVEGANEIATYLAHVHGIGRPH
ncbi:MAG: DUF3088 domain-containing protein [Verrucomicrobiae bacterium]|nr:DUF3088 domain-containing protein [Verrucomicrobiae bacterium]MDW8309922.1 DUF3088 family protein [Verrucomicrobiales bacterium]